MQLYVLAGAATQKMAHDNEGNVDIMMSGVGTNQQCECAHTASFGSANINKTDEGKTFTILPHFYSQACYHHT